MVVVTAANAATWRLHPALEMECILELPCRYRSETQPPNTRSWCVMVNPRDLLTVASIVAGFGGNFIVFRLQRELGSTFMRPLKRGGAAR